MPNGLEIDHLRAMQELAHNTKIIAEQLSRLNSHSPIEYQLGKINETLTGIRGMLELLYKNGLPSSSK